MEHPKALTLWLIMGFIWDVLLFGGTAYLVFWRGESGWWFLGAICFGGCCFQPRQYHKFCDKVFCKEEDDKPC